MGLVNKAATYFHTVRHLRPVQIYGRAWFRFYRPQPRLEPAPPLRSGTAGWAVPAMKPPKMVSPTGFRFLSESHELSFPEDWNSSGREKLWLYNLHYFDDLNAHGAEEREAWHRALIEQWIRDNPPGHGNGWEPYPSSLRIVNWIKWALGGNRLEEAWLHSLAVQARYLSRRLEWHLLGNHLFANVKALVFAGVFFAGDEAEGWLAKGLKILSREIDEQIFGDGGHFERSPMYHSIIYEDLLDLINLFAVCPDALQAGWRAFPDRLRDLAGKMGAWLGSMTHPDGEIALFNDAAFNIAASPGELRQYAVRLGMSTGDSWRVAVTHLADSGYVRCELGGAVLIADVGEIGPDYLPGHAHADTLGFEMSLYGQRIFVDTGTSCYGGSEERLRQRSTRAHNTVEIDGQDSSEVWGGFRVARRARPKLFQIEEAGSQVQIRCAHDGYARLPGKPQHCRGWCFTADSLVVEDIIEGKFDMAVARYHLHPDISVEVSNSGREGHFVLPEKHRLAWHLSGGTANITSSTYHPVFGVSIPNKCLEIDIEGIKAAFSITWD